MYDYARGGTFWIPALSWTDRRAFCVFCIINGNSQRGGCIYLVWIWYVIMTCSDVCWIMLHSEFSTRFSKLRWCSAGASWLLRALRDVSDESLLAKYLLLLLLPVNHRNETTFMGITKIWPHFEGGSISPTSAAVTTRSAVVILLGCIITCGCSYRERAQLAVELVAQQAEVSRDRDLIIQMDTAGNRAWTWLETSLATHSFWDQWKLVWQLQHPQQGLICWE